MSFLTVIQDGAGKGQTPLTPNKFQSDQLIPALPPKRSCFTKKKMVTLDRLSYFNGIVQFDTDFHDYNYGTQLQRA